MSCPEVDQIMLHKTEQYPLPGMNHDESSIDGPSRSWKQLKRKQGWGPVILKHGWMFCWGWSLIAAPCWHSWTYAFFQYFIGLTCTIPDWSCFNATKEMLTKTFNNSGLFHGKMAGDCLVMNKHWGKPNQERVLLVGESTVRAEANDHRLEKGKKATPRKPAHELIQTSASAHIKDSFHLHFVWNKSCNMFKLQEVEAQWRWKLSLICADLMFEWAHVLVSVVCLFSFPTCGHWLLL